MTRDYYTTLGLDRNASEQEIKRAYRKLAQEHHPDKKSGDAARFKEINEAYQILSDPAKREQYDRFGRTFQGAPGGAGGFDFSGFRTHDFGDLGGFADLFETFFRGGTATRQASRPRGDDLEVELLLDFEEAVFGVTKTIRVNAPSVCDRCEGSGAEPGAGMRTCERCHGSGEEEVVQRTVLGQLRTLRTCSRCGGSGRIPEKVCTRCRGEGRIRRAREITVEVPTGVDNGHTIRIRGQGEAPPAGGPAGGEPGDLYVQVIVRPHASLRREGRHLLATAEVDMATAALGGIAEVPTLEEKKKIKIPPGTQSGKVVKLSGLGVPPLHGGRRGDLLVEIRVKTPGKLSRKARKLLEDLRDELK